MWGLGFRVLGLGVRDKVLGFPLASVEAWILSSANNEPSTGNWSYADP